MSQSKELIYTSAPSGLRTGSKGFCTVAMTAGMPAGLIGPLENLSAYRNVDGEVPPVNYSHLRMKVAGREVTVLSRISKTDADYTGRTNKLAHHIVVDSGDLAAAGPAAMLSSPGFLETKWDGKVGEYPSSKTVPSPSENPQVANQWETITGDAGWAGHLASMAVGGGAPIWVIHSPQQNPQLLKMMDEMLSILPSSHRWKVTFSTYCSEIPPGVTCRLRFVLAGSPEAVAAKNNPSTIDLSGRPIGQAPPSAAAQAARDGVLWDPSPSTQPPTGLPGEVASTSDQVALAETLAAEQSTTFQDTSFALPPNPLSGAAPPPRLDQQPTVDNHRNIWTIATIAAAMLVIIGTAVFYVSTQTNSVSLVDQLNAKAGISESQPRSPKQVPTEPADSEADLADTNRTNSDVIAPNPEPIMDPALAKAKQQRADELEKAKQLAIKLMEGETLLARNMEFRNRSLNANKNFKKIKSAIELSIPIPADIELLKDPRTAEVLASETLQPLKAVLTQQNQNIASLAKLSKDRKKEKTEIDSIWDQWKESFQRWQQFDDAFKLEADPENLIQNLRPQLSQQLVSATYEDEFSEKNRQQLLGQLKKQKSELETSQVKLRKRTQEVRNRHTLRIVFVDNSNRPGNSLGVKLLCPLSWIKTQSVESFIVGKDSNEAPTSVPSEGKEVPLGMKGLFLIRKGGMLQIEIRPSRSIPLASVNPVLAPLDAALELQIATKTYLEAVETIEQRQGLKIDPDSENPSRQRLFGNLQEAMKQEFIVGKLTAENENIANTAAKANSLTQKWKETKLANPLKHTAVDVKKHLDAVFGSPIAGLAELINEMVQFKKSFSSPRLDHVKVRFGELQADYKELQGHRLKLNEAYKKLASAKPFDLNAPVVLQRSDSTAAVGQSKFHKVETFDLYMIPKLFIEPASNAN